MKNIQIVGKYNSFSNAYNKGKLYVVSDDVMDIVVDLYVLSKLTSVLTINGHGPYHAEICEFSIKSGLCTIVIEVQTNESNISALASQQYSKSAVIDIEYDETKALPRVSNAFFTMLIKGMERMRKAMGLGSEMELKAIIDETYKFNKPIDSNMYAADAAQLLSYLKQYSEQYIKESIFIDDGTSTDVFMKKRIALSLCALCSNKMYVSDGGLPLCKKHDEERRRIGDKKFRNHYHL